MLDNGFFMWYNASMKVNYSAQREVVYDVLASTTCHPNAECVWEKCRERMPQISKATVYRNLECLVKLGRAIEVVGTFGSSHYDACVRPHNHMVCSVCGAVVDCFPSEELRLALEHETQAHGYTGYGLTFSGICEECKAKQLNK